MSEQTAVAESSAAPVVEIDRGPLVTLTPDQRTEFRKTGELPVKQEEAAASDPAKEPKAAASAPPAPKQETDRNGKRKPDVEQRIKTFSDENKRLRAELDALKAPKPQAEPAPRPTQQPQANTKPTVYDKNPDGTAKFKDYEEYVEALSDWKVGERWAQNERQQQQQAQAKEIATKVEDARARYGKEKFDAVIFPTNSAIVNDQQISPAVKAMLNDSEVLPDLLYALGSDPAELASFITMAKTNPGKALRYIALTESLVAEELAKPKADPEPPVKPQTAAPKPPQEVGGRSSSPPDALESAAQAGDFRRFKAESTRRYLVGLKA